MRAYAKRFQRDWAKNYIWPACNHADGRIRHVGPSKWRGLESLPSRIMLDGSPFGLASFTPLGENPVVVAGPTGLNGAPLLDLNNDGMGDLIVEYSNGVGAGSSSVAAVSALLVNADGSSTEYRIARYDIPSSAPLPVINQVLVGDFNGDGQPDVAVLHNDGASIMTHKWIDIFMGQPDGTFTEPTAPIDLGSAISTPTMTLFDQNGDGKTDIFLEDGTKFTAYLGNGDGTFAAPVVTNFQTLLFPLSLNKLSTVTNAWFQQDLNGDGIPDLVVSGQIPSFVQSGTHYALYVFKGQSDGSYDLTKPTFSDTKDNLTLLAMRQLSSDNNPDIVAYGSPVGSNSTVANSVFVFRNSGKGAFTESFDSGTFSNGLPTVALGLNAPEQALLTPDLTDDGIDDMILVEGGEGTSGSHVTLHIEKNNGNAGFTQTQEISFTSVPYDSSSLVHDVDGDGLPDLVVYNFTGNSGAVTTTIYFNHGGGVFDSVGLVPAASASVTPGSFPGLADFNGDGKLDLVYRGFNVATQKNVLEVLLNTTGRAFGAPVDSLVAASINLSQAGDIPPDPLLDYTGDGLADLLSDGGTETDGLSILAASSDGHFTLLNPPITFGDVLVPNAPIVTDFNNDNRLDFIWGNSVGAPEDNAGGLFIVINGVSTPVDTAGADPSTARDLGTLSGPTSLTEFVNTSVNPQPLDADDFYKFTLSSAQAVRVSAIGAVGDVSVRLEDSGGGTIDSSTQGSSFVDATLDAGTYYVDVEHSGGADTNYRLDIEFPPETPAIGVLQGFTTIVSGQTSSIDFGSVKIATTDTHKVFTIRNDGSATLNLDDISFPNGFTLNGMSPVLTLAPGASTTLSVAMDATAAGVFSGNITIPSDDPLTPSFQIPVSGAVTGPANTDVSGAFASTPAIPSTVAGAQSVPLSFDLTNGGPSDASGTYSIAFKLEKGVPQLGKGDVVAGTASGAMTLAAGATTVSAIDGTFTVPATLAPGTYYLAATITDAGGDIDTNAADKTFFSGEITVVRPATHLAFVEQPGGVIAGQSLASPVTLEVLDSTNHVVAIDDSDVTIHLTVPANGATLGGTLTASVIDGVATFSDLSMAKAGTYTLTAGDGALAAAKSKSFSVTADISSAGLFIAQQPAATTVGLALTPPLVVDIQDQFGNVITAGTYATSTVTLGIAAGPGGGNFNGNDTLAIKAAKGVATFSKAVLSEAGTYTLGVTDGNLGVLSPVQFTQTIAPGVSGLAAPHAASSYTFGQTITLSATLKSTAATTIPFTGTASILDQNSQILGTAEVSANGAMKFAFAAPAPGSYIATIDYPGDANHTALTSSSFTLVVNKAATKTALAVSATTLVFGQPLTLTATVGSTPGTARTGSINFFDGTTLLQTIALNGNSVATLTLTPSGVGKHSYKAVYSGDGDFIASTSSALSRTVAKDKTSIQLSLELPATSPILQNQTFNLDIHLTLIAPGASVVTGNPITIKDNGKILGVVNLDSNGDATLPGLSYTAAGSHSLTAIYLGDTDTLAAISSVLKLVAT